MESKNTASNHGLVFSLLVGLVLGSVAVSFLHLPALTNNLVIFGIALVMTALVSLQYMNLKIEGPLVVWTVIIPFLLFGVLVLVLLSDSSTHPIFAYLEKGLKLDGK